MNVPSGHENCAVRAQIEAGFEESKLPLPRIPIARSSAHSLFQTLADQLVEGLFFLDSEKLGSLDEGFGEGQGDVLFFHENLRWETFLHKNRCNTYLGECQMGQKVPAGRFLHLTSSPNRGASPAKETVLAMLVLWGPYANLLLKIS
jgi:hypothetical protein